jgi:lysosomal acid lipase/cholesteryl ester hydrolase
VNSLFFLCVGGQDILADVQDVMLLRNDLDNHDPIKLVVLVKDDYAHVDFGVAVNAKQVFYDPIIAFFQCLLILQQIILFSIELC